MEQPGMSEQDESEGRRLARKEVAQKLIDPLHHAISLGLLSEAALIATLINAILTNQTADLLMALRTTKPSA